MEHDDVFHGHSMEYSTWNPIRSLGVSMENCMFCPHGIPHHMEYNTGTSLLQDRRKFNAKVTDACAKVAETSQTSKKLLRRDEA